MAGIANYVASPAAITIATVSENGIIQATEEALSRIVQAAYSFPSHSTK